ncbi:MAG: tetratricopeptide repeat protein [Bacteroidetes bacterium]|nr:tetratricopeptide repeat protein [Bacteroidota bacterium]
MTKKKSSVISRQPSVINQNWFFTHPFKIIFLTCILLYAQILTFGLVYFDDHGFVLLAKDALKFSNIPEFFNHSVFWVMGDTSQQYDIFYRPLQNVLYAICNTIASGQPWIYHCFGLSFHILACFALFIFLKELKFHSSVSLVFTIIYSVHPVLVQSVAWIAGIGDQMVTIFSLVSIICFIKLISEPKFNPKYFLIHFFAFLFALFSKEVSVMLILIFIFYLFFLNKNKSKRLLLLSSAGCFFAATIYFLFRKHALPPMYGNIFDSLTGSVKANGLLVFEYLEKIFLPYRLSPIPSREDAQIILGGIIFIGLIFFFVFRKRITAMAIFGVLWFSVFLFPTLIQQNPQAHFFAFEHRLYLPLIGVLIMVIELINLKEINLNLPFQKYSFALLLILFFGITFSHSRTFNNPHTFYDKALSSSPQSVVAYNGYAKLLLKDEKYAEAVGALKKSFQYEPKDIQTTGKIAEIYLKNLNNPDEAIIWFKKTLEIDSSSIEAAVSIGDAYWNFLHDTLNAIIWYNHALKINSANEFALTNLGVIYTGKGKNEEAKKYLSQALHSNPKSVLALKWMAISYFNEGKISEAVNYLMKAFETNPDDGDVLRNLMICYYKLNDAVNTKKFAELVFKNKNQIPVEIEKYIRKN